jgi:hypothetical protein
MEKNGDSTKPLAKRKQRPREAWLKDVCSLRDSGLSPEEYAKKKGLDPGRLKFWMRVLGNDVGRRVKSAVPAFLPVNVVQAAEVPKFGANVMIEVDLANGRRVRLHVSPNADFKRVSELLSAVEGGLRC